MVKIEIKKQKWPLLFLYFVMKTRFHSSNISKYQINI